MGYLAKVMQSLSRTKLVHSQRGLNGGFTLTRDPAALPMLEIIGAVDPIRRFHECPLGLPPHETDLCPLHRTLEEAAQLLEKKFGETSVADTDRRSGRRRLGPARTGRSGSGLTNQPDRAAAARQLG